MSSRYLCCLCDGFFVLQKNIYSLSQKLNIWLTPKNIYHNGSKTVPYPVANKNAVPFMVPQKKRKYFGAFLKNQEHFVCTYVVDK